MNDGEIGSERWLIRRFDTFVRDELFDGHRPAQGRPLLVLLGGQPAAGKTRAQQELLVRHSSRDLVEITGDDLREFHPDYARLALEEPLAMPAATAPVSGGLVRLALEHALRERYSVLLEGTFRDAAMVTGTAARFAASLYEVEVVAVATPAAVSRLSAEGRSLDADLIDYRGLGAPPAAGRMRSIGRWTPPEAHEIAVRASSQVLAALAAVPGISRIEVRSRDRLLIEDVRAGNGRWTSAGSPAAVLRAEQTRTLGPKAAAAWLQQYQHVFVLATERSGYLQEDTGPAYRQLQFDARGMIRVATETCTGDIAVFTDQQRARRDYLEQHGLLDPLRDRSVASGALHLPRPRLLSLPDPSTSPEQSRARHQEYLHRPHNGGLDI